MRELPHFSKIIYVRAVTLALVFNEIGKNYYLVKQFT